LPEAALSEEVVDDYRSLRLSLKAHPVSFLRGELAALGLVEAARLAELPDGSWVKLAGLVLVRQRPGSAKGVTFATLEDETGVANTIVWADVFARYRQTVLKASLLMVEGRLQREQTVIHLVAQRQRRPSRGPWQEPTRSNARAGSCATCRPGPTRSIHRAISTEHVRGAAGRKTADLNFS
jgi:DNA polymerase III alpha subunit